MQSPFTYKVLVETITDIFINLDKYKLAKHIEEFKNGETYLGDFLVYYIYEQRENLPPIFYTINSPYDTITKKSPQQALIFSDGELKLDIDFTHYVDVRTGVMDPLMLQKLGISSLDDKKVLYIGTGNIAIESIKSIKELFPEITSVDFYNRKKNAGTFGEVATSLGITTTYVELSLLHNYDVILCHTNSPEPVLTSEYTNNIKKGALLFTYVTVASDKGELADEFFDSQKANVLMDWPNTLTMAKDIDNAISKGFLNKDKLILLQDLFSGRVNIDTAKDYTVFRSSGTPMQNLAVLKLLMR